MSRRRDSSVANALFTLVVKLPWWAGVMLAVASYALFHHWASQPAALNTRPGQLGTSIVPVMWQALATGLQYVAPLICLMAAAASAWRNRQLQQSVADVAQSHSASALNGMSWQQFERLVGEGFRMQGYRVIESGGGGADGGVDLMLSKGTEKFLVQCKQWRATKVGVQVVRELYGAMAARGAAGGFVVTSGRFTDEATAFAEGRNIQLIDGPQLHALIRRAQNAPASAHSSAQIEVGSKANPPRTTNLQAPACPVCGKSMIKRTAKRGHNAGTEFWGCTGYPGCRGTRAIG